MYDIKLGMLQVHKEVSLRSYGTAKLRTVEGTSSKYFKGISLATPEK